MTSAHRVINSNFPATHVSATRRPLRRFRFRFSRAPTLRAHAIPTEYFYDRVIFACHGEKFSVEEIELQINISRIGIPVELTGNFLVSNGIYVISKRRSLTF